MSNKNTKTVIFTKLSILVVTYVQRIYLIKLLYGTVDVLFILNFT